MQSVLIWSAAALLPVGLIVLALTVAGSLRSLRAPSGRDARGVRWRDREVARRSLRFRSHNPSETP